MRTAYVIAGLAFTSLIASGAPLPRDEPRCAFADDAFMTMLAVSTAVTAYYVRHQRWPATTHDIRAQCLEIARRMRPPDKPSAADIDQLLSRFSRTDLQPRGRNLVLAVDYRAAGKRHRHRMLIPPGRSSDEMLQASSEIK